MGKKLGDSKSADPINHNTPLAMGFTLPAEWEPDEATWLAWPHQVSDWPGKFSPIPWVFGEIVKKISAGEKVCVLVQSKQHATMARRTLARLGVEA